jgi:hypothetical protein
MQQGGKKKRRKQATQQHQQQQGQEEQLNTGAVAAAAAVAAGSNDVGVSLSRDACESLQWVKGMLWTMSMYFAGEGAGNTISYISFACGSTVRIERGDWGHPAVLSAWLRPGDSAFGPGNSVL